MGNIISSGGAASIPAGIVPIGGIIPYGGASPYPGGYLLCDGAAVSRITFADLFAIIGIAYGPGDGSTTFNVPDMKTINNFARGAVNDAGRGNTGGAPTHVLTTAQLAAHDHPRGPSGKSLSNSADPTGGVHPSNPNIATVNQTNRAAVVTGSAGSGTAHNNEPQFVDFNWIIKT